MLAVAHVVTDARSEDRGVHVRKRRAGGDAAFRIALSGITTGWDDGTFRPLNSCNRAAVVTFLYRNAGTPEVKAKNPFKDVSSGAYYYDAVLWAVKNEITKGTSATAFSPSQTCTRGQIVTFLYRGLAEK